MNATKRRIALEIVATDTHCAQCPCLVLEGGARWYCQAFLRRLKHAERDRAHRLPECIAAEKAQKGDGGE